MWILGQKSADPEREKYMKCWSKEQVWEWYQKQPWIAGFNYVPSNSVNSTEMWQEEVFDADLVECELGK